jgi:hypothetical protein
MQEKLFEEIDGEWMPYGRAGTLVRVTTKLKFSDLKVIEAFAKEPGFDVWCKPDGRGWNVLFGVFRRKIEQYCARRDAELNARKSADDAKPLETVLSKSGWDPFMYALQVRTGDVFAFTSSTQLNKEWLHLSGARVIAVDDPLLPASFGLISDRGIDVRISDIVWMIDDAQVHGEWPG